jgi:glycosyltransferase involved in cell wall biosynthesis
MKFIVAQLGARMHYAVPRILSSAGLLYRFYTDFYLKTNSLTVVAAWQCSPTRIKSTLSRYSTALPDHQVNASVCAGLTTKLELFAARTPLQAAHANIRAARWLAKRVSAADVSCANVVYGFDTASVELFTRGRSRKMFLILEQCVAPRVTQKRILTELGNAEGMVPNTSQQKAWDILSVREEMEWKMADLVICPSDFVREEICQNGVLRSKTAVVPYGVDMPDVSIPQAVQQRDFQRKEKTFKVLFIGNVGLRKGILSLIRTASILGGEHYEFIVAGPVSIQQNLLPQNLPNIRFLGKQTKIQLAELYAQADCFMLPSYLEGSATVVYEALAWGLPVVTTRAAGSVIEHGKSGFIGEAGDVRFFVDSLKALRENSALSRKMSEEAKKLSSEFTITGYGKRLVAVLMKAMSDKT